MLREITLPVKDISKLLTIEYIQAVARLYGILDLVGDFNSILVSVNSAEKEHNKKVFIN